MSIHANARARSRGEAVLAACRNAWFAGLGAVAITRDWLDADAAPMLRALVVEGTRVEARAMRAAASRARSSYALAEGTWRRAQHQARAVIREARSALPGVLATLPAPIARIARPHAAGAASPARARKPARKSPVKRIARKPAARARKRA